MSNSTILELPPDFPLPTKATAELNERLLWIGQQIQTLDASINQPGQFTVAGPRAQRLNIASFDANNYKGALFFETDTGLSYLSQPLASGGAGYVWRYMTGTVTSVYSSPLNAAGVFGAPLGTLDKGLLLYLSDKHRTMRWDGAAWTFAPSEVIPPGMILGFKVNPGAGWHICDGSSQTQLNGDGTTASVTLDDLTSVGTKAAYPKWGSVADGLQAAIAPTIGGHTDNNTGTTVQAQPYATGTAVVVPTNPHIHNLTPPNAPIAGGEPQHYDLVPYQRL